MYRGSMGAAAHVRHAATRMTVSIGVAVLVVMAAIVPAPSSPVSPAVKLSADSTALIMGTSTVPTPDDFWLETVMNQFIAPTHPGQTMEPVAVTTPEEGWPLNGLLRLLGLALGPPEIWGPGGAGWPDEPWWKLSGLFDLTLNPSLQAGVGDLEQTMTEHGDNDLVIYGYSQSAIIANLEKQRLAEQYPVGTTAPDIDFVLGGDFNLPNGGLFARFPGLYIPIIDWSFNGPEPTDTPFDTVVITRQYDSFADFPLYPINLVADLNAVLGFFYVHLYPFNVTLAPDPSTSPAYQGTHGDTSYYFFPTEDLPLFGPLRNLGVPESVIDVVEPFFRVLVELGYDRSIPPWEPTPARLIPTLDPAKVTADLVTAIGEGINNALALVGLPAPPNIPATRPIEPATVDVARQVGSTGTTTGTDRTTSTGTSMPTQPASQATASEIPQATTGRTSETTQATSTGDSTATRQTPSMGTSTEANQATSIGAAAQTDPATAAAAIAAAPSNKPAPTPAASASMPNPAKPAGGLHRGNGGQPTNQTATAGKTAPTPRHSSAPSSSRGSSSTDSASRAGTAGGAGGGS